jgi:putative endopeptidase
MKQTSPWRLMNGVWRMLAVVGVVTLAGVGSGTSAPAAARVQESTTAALDASDFDITCDACDDFFRFVNGGWMQRHERPPSSATWGRFDLQREQHNLLLRELLDGAARPDPGRDPVTRQVGDFYASCTAGRPSGPGGFDALQPELLAIHRIRDRDEVAAVIAQLHLVGVAAAFRFTVEPDERDATRFIAVAGQGGLTLTWDHYRNAEARSVALRSRYRSHVARMLAHAGADPAAATRDADAVLAVEAALADVSLSPTQQRDVRSAYNRVDRAGLQMRLVRVPQRPGQDA